VLSFRSSFVRSILDFFHGCQRRIVLEIFVPVVMSPTMVIHILGSPAASTRLFRFFSLVLVLMSMLVNYFNDTRPCSFGIAAQSKVMGEASLVFTCLWFDISVIFLWSPSKRYKIVSLKKKEFEDLEDLLVSFKLCFVIVEFSSCISTMYYFLL
jgi:hypothetical protein